MHIISVIFFWQILDVSSQSQWLSCLYNRLRLKASSQLKFSLKSCSFSKNINIQLLFDFPICNFSDNFSQKSRGLKASSQLSEKYHWHLATILRQTREFTSRSSQVTKFCAFRVITTGLPYELRWMIVWLQRAAIVCCYLAVDNH
jgi:hypothetical protein